MKFLLLLLLAPVVFGQSIEERVKKFEKPKDYVVEYDKFDKSTEVTFDATIPSSKKGRMPLTITAYLRQTDTGRNSFGIIILDIANRYNSYLYSHDPLKFLLDGELLNVGETGIGYTTSLSIRPEHWEMIAQAKVVEMQLGPFEGKFDEKAMQKFRNLASLAR